MNILTLFPAAPSASALAPGMPAGRENAMPATVMEIPGSKSYTIRALLLAALTPQPVRLVRPLFSDDTQAMLRCLITLGIQVEVNADAITVVGDIRDVEACEYTLDADLSAATLRFLLALCAVLPGMQTLSGQEGLNRRPVADLVDSLRQLGAEIEYLERDGYPPVRVSAPTETLAAGLAAGITSATSKQNSAPANEPASVGGARITVSGRTSSQYLSALMMIAPLLGGLTLEIEGDLISRPYVAMTADIMRHFGAEVDDAQAQCVQVSAQPYRMTLTDLEDATYQIEPDASSAAYFLAVAALTHSTVRIPNLPQTSVQADLRFADILARMGNTLRWEENTLVLEGHGVQALTVDMRDCPDQAQTLAVLAAFAEGVTRIEGLQSLRVKETDRLQALETELRKMGIQAEAGPDWLVIPGGSPRPARIATYGDHRMAMAFAVAGCRVPGLQIEAPEVVSKTYPRFWDDLTRMGIEIQRPSEAAGSSLLQSPDLQAPTERIVLIGFMGSGKSGLAPLLAEQLGFEPIEMDALVVQRSGRDSVCEIFEGDGETRFRELELETARELRNRAQTVIATGGGIVMNKLAIDYLAQNGTVIYLETGLETALSRLRDSADRPLLKGNPARVKDLYALRAPLYRHYGEIHVLTDGKTPDSIVTEILRQLRERGRQPVSPEPKEVRT